MQSTCNKILTKWTETDHLIKLSDYTAKSGLTKQSLCNKPKECKLIYTSIRIIAVFLILLLVLNLSKAK